MTRTIVHKTRGYGHGPIARLMSPADLGEQLKPFVFLDLFEADLRALTGSMPVHPHSGIATVTVFEAAAGCRRRSAHRSGVHTGIPRVTEIETTNLRRMP